MPIVVVVFGEAKIAFVDNRILGFCSVIMQVQCTCTCASDGPKMVFIADA